MIDIIKKIAEDNEIRKLLMKAFMWRGNKTRCNNMIEKLADKIYEKHGIDIGIYT